MKAAKQEKLQFFLSMTSLRVLLEYIIYSKSCWVMCRLNARPPLEMESFKTQDYCLKVSIYKRKSILSTKLAIVFFS